MKSKAPTGQPQFKAVNEVIPYGTFLATVVPIGLAGPSGLTLRQRPIPSLTVSVIWFGHEYLAKTMLR